MRHLAVIVLAFTWLSAAAADTDAGRLPLAYRTTEGAYPWTGRLFALGWQGAAGASPASYLWEAGNLLDQRPPASRRIVTSSAPTDEAPEQLVEPAAATSGNGDQSARLDWLRGAQSVSGLRPRDTALGYAAGARVRVVAPPAWAPGKPGHTAFRLRYGLRRHMAWLGTADGLLHAFDAVTGDERAAYLPRTLLPYALALPQAGAPLLPAPCPRPEAQDVTVRGEWRTVLLCGIVGSPATGNPAAVLALDVSDPEALQPFGMLWEATASDTLPISARGPIRAAGIPDTAGVRWHAVVTLARALYGRSGLLLLPLDKPAGAAWAGKYAPRLLPLPERDCADKPAMADLIAVSVLADMAGQAVAAYATDDAGQLWRFPLAGAGVAACLHSTPGQAQPPVDEAPVLLGSPTAPVVVYGRGNGLSAVPDPAQGSTPGAVPAQIAIQASDGGYILRAPAANADAAPYAGWQLTLPHPGEQVEQLESVFPGHLMFVTRTPDGVRRGYLVLAATGDSVVRDSRGQAVHMATGQVLPAGATVFVNTTPVPGGATTPGLSASEAYALSLWAADGKGATLLTQTLASRRTGRLRWREIIGPATEDKP
ncbi:pilus assembly protein PilY [Cupriavidus sp. AcVe19-1a]|uniref:pilus assembly protein PilY n=1 Tax=Cupriavidus sp. AcVe19-1a TaxID=2821359 RepID=UPI001AE76A74|nr:pilus assembly protein PilY [Cupriavidus sp. AcVe19-1a]MBP0629966.1 pilus assembly protein PilY [Cupriavidus sp. AcVe19-1a]